jgi:hypothetical protein
MPSQDPWPYDPRVQELLKAFLRMAKKTHKPYAIGGALAMAAHGYVRQTTDVDAFLRDEDRLDWLRAARAEGLHIDELYHRIHYIAFDLKHGDPRIRIDLMFPAEEPALSAIDIPDTATIGNLSFDVFPIDMLVIAKFDSDRDKDQNDVAAMYHLGLFDPVRVHKIMSSLDRDMATRFAARIQELNRPRLPPPARRR